MPKYKVTGKCIGMTGYRGQFYFSNGICSISDADNDDAALHRRIAARLLPRDYAAYPLEIADEMQKRWLDKEERRKSARRKTLHGGGNIQTDGQEGAAPPVSGGVRSAWDSVAKESEANDGTGPAQNAAGSPQPSTAEETSDSTIRLKAVNQAARDLSWQDDAHWTGGGKARLDHMSAGAGFDVTRDDVEAVLPGFDRSMAQQLAGA